MSLFARSGALLTVTRRYGPLGEDALILIDVWLYKDNFMLIEFSELDDTSFSLKP